MEGQALVEDQDKGGEKGGGVFTLPRLQGGFDASLQLARTKKPCGCLRTSEDKMMGIKVLRGGNIQFVRWQ